MYVHTYVIVSVCNGICIHLWCTNIHPLLYWHFFCYSKNRAKFMFGVELVCKELSHCVFSKAKLLVQFLFKYLNKWYFFSGKGCPETIGTCRIVIRNTHRVVLDLVLTPVASSSGKPALNNPISIQLRICKTKLKIIYAERSRLTRSKNLWQLFTAGKAQRTEVTGN